MLDIENNIAGENTIQDIWEMDLKYLAETNETSDWDWPFLSSWNENNDNQTSATISEIRSQIEIENDIDSKFDIINEKLNSEYFEIPLSNEKKQDIVDMYFILTSDIFSDKNYLDLSLEIQYKTTVLILKIQCIAAWVDELDLWQKTIQTNHQINLWNHELNFDIWNIAVSELYKDQWDIKLQEIQKNYQEYILSYNYIKKIMIQLYHKLYPQIIIDRIKIYPNPIKKWEILNIEFDLSENEFENQINQINQKIITNSGDITSLLPWDKPPDIDIDSNHTIIVLDNPNNWDEEVDDIKYGDFPTMVQWGSVIWMQLKDAWIYQIWASSLMLIMNLISIANEEEQKLSWQELINALDLLKDNYLNWFDHGLSWSFYNMKWQRSNISWSAKYKFMLDNPVTYKTTLPVWIHLLQFGNISKKVVVTE